MGRIYDTARWQRLRALKLSEQPLCEPCFRRGRLVQAEAVDHVLSMANGGEAFPALDGLMSMCTPCHSIKTNALDRAGGKGVAFKGCDQDGMPLDPDHPFVSDRARLLRTGGIPPSRTTGKILPTGVEGQITVSFENGGVKSSNILENGATSAAGEIVREWF